MPDYLDLDDTGQPAPTPRRALAGLPVQHDNVTTGGDQSVSIADPTTPSQRVKVDAAGSVGVRMDLSTQELLTLLLHEMQRMRQGMALMGLIEDLTPDEASDDTT